MRLSTLVRLSLAGNRTDRLRTALTAASAALAAVALLAAAAVASIRGGDLIDDPESLRTRTPGSEHYASALLAEGGLRPGVIFTILMLALPVLALAGQCIRLGAPARDRRLAALRLSGATPRQTVLIAGAETAAASLLGSVIGLGVFAVLRATLDPRSADGRLWLPVDVVPDPLLVVGALLLVPLLAGAIGVLLMRRVVITPLGVVRRLREKGPWPWPGVLIGVGLVAFIGPEVLPDDRAAGLPEQAPLYFMAVGVLLATLGVILGVGWISYTAGRLLRRYGKGAGTLLAGARLMADPWNGSRTLGALLAAIVVGAGTLSFRTMLVTDFEASARYEEIIEGTDYSGYGSVSDLGFYLGAIRLLMVAVSIAVAVAAAGVLIAFVEGIVARRRTYAALTATGVPRRTLTSVLLWHTFVPLIPALLVALATGAALFRMTGTEITLGAPYQQCVDPNPVSWETCAKETVVPPTLVVPVPIPFADLALLGGGALAAMLLVVGVCAVVLRTSADLEELRVG
ncbi:putative permease [Actinoplanes missouriensis 431]|uniref:Putative permease n=1 Tax=Actinoplanes missouriensis (strain ATCC 14538 / DSM 43046 / CBS 188.64 / JCM 3121 / NBRC 102363 / NCIMB 12654 / NRRL B-3342 / UNCC 431) TaxID=512565 RepID=I0GXA8_ACTM4|nr:FtsX-like permease family protein [Actinoplanes missouriensis]BAL85395.1 putative permease [Actinoplanes missouriensis 431]